MNLPFDHGDALRSVGLLIAIEQLAQTLLGHQQEVDIQITNLDSAIVQLTQQLRLANIPSVSLPWEFAREVWTRPRPFYDVYDSV